MRRAAALAAGWLLLGSASYGDESGAEPAEEHPLCRAMVERLPSDPLGALEAAETERVRTAKSAWRRAKRNLGRTVGAGPGDPRNTRDMAGHMEAFERNMAEARIFCGCREARGDPHREDCDWLYRELRTPGPR